MTDSLSTEDRSPVNLRSIGRNAHKLDDEAYKKFWVERVMLRTTKTESGCWLWQGTKHTAGYGLTTYRSKAVQIHRRMYMLTHKVDLRSDQLVCHHCDVRLCHNPDHLWVGTPFDNTQDMMKKKRHAEQRVTSCPKGHPYDEQNTYIAPKNGARSCKACQRARQLERYRADRVGHNARNKLYRQRRKEREAARG